ncbi:membrane protein DedA, SNARE-associated domain [Streptomyces sp. SceaMP-e96]|uniref:DedA family protein n=1 Tax=Streptomyces TaxID=1883 RepID=UPI000823CFCA|nr:MULTISPECIES: DedA family protein [unclassified Streptomyces]MYT15977.1 DedA family protein [Streptomyces sp. SID4951]SCK26138.1 membrane protein DedA, SNARE-associated domain [Streptomyces sp. SceaMP-e96]
MSDLTTLLSQIPPATAYTVLAAAIIAESILLVGAVVPTLALMLTAGALARAGSMNLLWVIGVAAGAVVIGDALGHRTGHLLGNRLRTGKLGRRIPASAWQRAETLMNKRAGQTLLIFRFVPVMRTLAPHLAGVVGLPYRHIAPYSALASVTWASVESGAGYTAAFSAQHLAAI